MVLFAWMQFLKEETLSYLNISSPYELKMCPPGKGQSRTPPVPLGAEKDCGGAAGSAAAEGELLDARAVQDVDSLSSLVREILDFDQAQQRKCFNSKMYLCNICFCEKLGSDCMYFSECSHVYCRACLKDYFEIQIRDGQVRCLNCPEPKCSSVATPGQVTAACGQSPAPAAPRRRRAGAAPAECRQPAWGRCFSVLGAPRGVRSYSCITGHSFSPRG